MASMRPLMGALRPPSSPAAARRRAAVAAVAIGHARPCGGAWRRVEQVGGHDQRVLAVVRVVARPHADRPEAEALVEVARRDVAEAHLERGHRRAQVAAPGSSPPASAAPRCPRRRHSGSTAKVVTCASSTISQMPGVGDRLVARPDHQVARHAVRLQLLAERVGGPRDRGSWRARCRGRRGCPPPSWLDAQPQRRSGDHVIPAAAGPMPRGSAT